MQKGQAQLLILAGILVVGLIAGGAYYFSSNKLKSDTSTVSNLQQELKQMRIQLEETKDKLGSFIDIGSFGPTPPEIPFKCFKSSELPDNNQVKYVSSFLKGEGRVIQTLCTKNNNQSIILTRGASTKDEPKIADLSIYNINLSTGLVIGSIPFSRLGIDKDNPTSFLLKKWYQNGEFLFTVFEFGKGFFYKARTYLSEEGGRTYELVEYCEIGIRGETSERELTICKSFNNSKSSKYLQKQDLP